jgi:hypothetical protein
MKFSFLLIYCCFFSGIFSQEFLIPKFNEEESRWQYIDTNDNVDLDLQDFKLENAQFFSDKLAAIQDANTKLWGYIDLKGKLVIPMEYQTADFFLDSYALVGKPCTDDCNKGNEGLLSDVNTYIINKSGKIIAQDNAQDERAYARYFLWENIGKGLFTIQRGIGLGERQDFMNYKAEILGETINHYGKGGIIWDDEVQAVKCGLKYFNHAGEIVLDLSQYQLVFGSFKNGYIWSMQEREVSPDVYESSYKLIDLKGKEVMSFTSEEYSSVSDVEDGKFSCLNVKDNNYYECNIKTKTFKKTKNRDITNASDYEIIGPKLHDGSRLILTENGETIIGIQFKSGRKYYLYFQE